MLKYLGKRIARSFLTLIIILTVVFCLLRLMPIEGYFTNFDKLTPQQIQNLPGECAGSGDSGR